MNTGILRGVHADEYGFGISDLTVAAMLKAYLQQMKEEAAAEALKRVVKTEGINKTELAVLIDNARVSSFPLCSSRGEERLWRYKRRSTRPMSLLSAIM